jgi:hypothetical protein
MTARDENRHSPSRRECAGALAQTSAQIQADRWERLLAEGPAAVAAAAWAPWMIGSKVDLAQYYSGLMEKARKAGAA